MPVGLQVWNEAGQLVFDTSDYAGRIVGIKTLPSSGGPSNNVNATLNPPIPAGMTAFYAVVEYNVQGYQLFLNVNSIGGSNVNYNSNSEFTIWYGYY